MSDLLFWIEQEGGGVELNKTTSKKRVIRPGILFPWWLVCKTLLQPSQQQHLQFSTCTFKHFRVFALLYIGDCFMLEYQPSPSIPRSSQDSCYNKEIRKGTRVRYMGHLCRVLPLYRDSVMRWICWEGTGILCEPHSQIKSLRKPATESTRTNGV